MGKTVGFGTDGRHGCSWTNSDFPTGHNTFLPPCSFEGRDVDAVGFSLGSVSVG